MKQAKKLDVIYKLTPEGKRKAGEKPKKVKKPRKKVTFKEFCHGVKKKIRPEKVPDVNEIQAGAVSVLDVLAPTFVDTKSHEYIIVDSVYHAYLYIAGMGYNTRVGMGWLNTLVEAGEGVNLNFILKRQPRDKMLSKIAQTTMINRSRMRDVGDTRADYEELDSAIASGLYIKDTMNRDGQDFYYMHTIIEIIAEDAETLERRLSDALTL